jgi:hypothetical protein
VSRLLSEGSISPRSAGLQAQIESPAAMQCELLQAEGQDDAKRGAKRCITVEQEAARQAAERGWLG